MLTRTLLVLTLLASLLACSLPAGLLQLLTPTPDYQPPPEIVKLADAATMTDKARTLFYATQPEVDADRNLFEQHCSAPVSATSVELGCYTPDNRIYLLKLASPQLSQEIVVTAAHEMLHAAYAQLSTSQRASVDSQVQAQAAKIHDRNLIQELRQYRVTEPGQQNNELHSILGTEYAPLDPGLEQYYSQYFLNRIAVVTYARQFNQLFTGLEATINNLQSQITALRQQMDADRKRGNTKAYNSLVPRYNALVQQYNQAVEQYNSLSRSLLGQEAPATSQ